MSRMRPLPPGTWPFIGPCAHGRDPWTRCDTCEDVADEAEEMILQELGLERASVTYEQSERVRNVIAQAIAVAAGTTEAK